jgi:hypothetical protein
MSTNNIQPTNSITKVYEQGARTRHIFEKEEQKTPINEQRRVKTRKNKPTAKRIYKEKVFGTKAVHKAIKKNSLPKTPELSKDIAMLDAFWDTSSQFFKKYVSANVPKATQSLKSISSKWWTTFAKHPKLSFAAIGVIGGVTAFNLIRGSFADKRQSTAIPKEYERGYDLINEYTSNFGSPVKASVVTRALVPYISSVRRAIIKNVDGIMKSNPALVSANNAIGHTRY